MSLRENCVNQLTHTFYIDESGTKEYADERVKYGKGRSRFFVFGGVLASMAVSGQLANEIAKLKVEYF